MRIGDISARCPKCGSTRFLDAGEGKERFTCAECGTTTSRAVLVDQIARESIKHADELLRTRRKPP
jgi:ribosomal protein S27AE